MATSDKPPTHDRQKFNILKPISSNPHNQTEYENIRYRSTFCPGLKWFTSACQNSPSRKPRLSVESGRNMG